MIIKRKARGQTVIILVLLLSLIIGVVTYFGWQYFAQQTQPSSINFSPTPSPTPSPPSTFQELLTKNCKVMRFDYGTITVDQLPVRIDAFILKEISSKHGISCQRVDAPYTWYVDIGKVTLYDDYSEELLAGTYPLFTYSKYDPEYIIKKTDDTTLGIRLGGTTGHVGDTSVVAEGIKRFELSNGQVFYANTGDIVIDFDDPRLIALLKQYAKPETEGSDRLVITKPGVEQAIIKKFFSNLEQVDTPEKKMIANIERVLNGISLK